MRRNIQDCKQLMENPVSVKEKKAEYKHGDFYLKTLKDHRKINPQVPSYRDSSMK